MPIYEFQCTECDLVHEITMSMSQVGIDTVWCPECHGECTRVFITAPRLQSSTISETCSGITKKGWK